LEQLIDQAVEDNPALERIESVVEDSVAQQFSSRRGNVERIAEWDQGESSDLETDPITSAPDESMTLREYLSRELHAQLPEHQYYIVDYMLDFLDDHGLLPGFDCDRASLETGASPEEVEEVLKTLQSLDPPGVGARSVQECALLQLRYLREQGKGNLLAERIVEKYFDRLASPPVRQMARELKATHAEVEEALEYIRLALHPYPAHRFHMPWGTVPASQRETIKPDVIIRRNTVGFEVEVVRPRWILIVSPEWRTYYERIKQNPDEYPPETVQQVKEYVEHAEEFLRNLDARYRTLHRITRAVIDQQLNFVVSGLRTYLKPLTRSQIADMLHISESTVSRATRNKWVLMPSGELIPFAHFFSASLGIRDAILEIVREEDPHHPYSDQEIADLAYERYGIKLSRRTVVKHRNRLNVPSSRDRKRKR